MIRRASDIRQEVRTKARNGNGQVYFNHLLESEEYLNKGRLFGKIVIPPQASIGYHTHTDEMEIFYILEGQATVYQDANTYMLNPGDVMITRAGESHCVENNLSKDLIYVALILNI